jgi:hypothetical protein
VYTEHGLVQIVSVHWSCGNRLLAYAQHTIANRKRTLSIRQQFFSTCSAYFSLKILKYLYKKHVDGKSHAWAPLRWSELNIRHDGSFMITVSKLWGAGGAPGPIYNSMDQISIKTPNHKCRLYWCSIEFIDWRHSQSCWYVRLRLWTSAPLTFSLVHLPPPPLLCE